MGFRSEAEPEVTETDFEGSDHAPSDSESETGVQLASATEYDYEEDEHHTTVEVLSDTDTDGDVGNNHGDAAHKSESIKKRNCCVYYWARWTGLCLLGVAAVLVPYFCYTQCQGLIYLRDVNQIKPNQMVERTPKYPKRTRPLSELTDDISFHGTDWVCKPQPDSKDFVSVRAFEHHQAALTSKQEELCGLLNSKEWYQQRAPLTCSGENVLPDEIPICFENTPEDVNTTELVELANRWGSAIDRTFVERETPNCLKVEWQDDFVQKKKDPWRLFNLTCGRVETVKVDDTVKSGNGHTKPVVEMNAADSLCATEMGTPAVFIHEIGHVLGLTHTDEKQLAEADGMTVMNEKGNNSVLVPTELEIARLQALYARTGG